MVHTQDIAIAHSTVTSRVSAEISSSSGRDGPVSIDRCRSTHACSSRRFVTASSTTAHRARSLSAPAPRLTTARTLRDEPRSPRLRARVRLGSCAPTRPPGSQTCRSTLRQRRSRQVPGRPSSRGSKESRRSDDRQGSECSVGKENTCTYVPSRSRRAVPTGRSPGTAASRLPSRKDDR